MKIFYCILSFLFTLFTFAQCLPVLDLPFNGNSQDISGNNNHGIPSGTPTLVNDRFGNPNSAYDFGGVGDVDFFTVINNSTLQFSNELSISYWFNQCSFQGMNGWGQTVPNGQHIIMAKLGDGFAAQPGFWNALNVNSATNQLNWGFCNKNGYNVTPNFCVNSTFNCIDFCEWVHVVVIFNIDNCKTYFNGQLVLNQQINPVDFSVSNTKNLLVGKMDGTWYPFKGTIDDIKIYNCSINETTVANLFGGYTDSNNSNVNPTFDNIGIICEGQNFNLPTTSNNGIIGTWSPSINNQATTTYIFTPEAGQCANSVQMTVQVGNGFNPTFNSIPPICQGGSITLPTQSTNGISGTWSPAVNNQATTVYTFTPTTGQCASTVQLTVVVNDKPIVNLEDKILCFNMDSQSYNPVLIDSGLPQQFFHFQWFFTPPNGTIQSINSNGNSIWVDLEGTYSLLVTNSATNCSSDLVSFQASTYNMPQDITVGVFNHFSDNAHISIQVLGNDESLQYQLNNDPSQGFPFFTNLSNGLYLVKVFNENNCFYFEKQVVVLNYMKFFTPNNDGYNDNWLFEDPFNYINKVTIFDRYGKLIKELNMNEVNIGWDGQYNGRNLPSSDYWFVVDYTIENINYIFSKHFSLKR